MKELLEIDYSICSHKGQKQINQDFNAIKVPNGHQLINKGITVALADGISSSDVSQDASALAVETFISDYYNTPETWSVKKSAERIIKTINSWLYSKSRESEYRYDRDRGYVCTFSAIVLKSNTAHIFHVGDVRIYLLREGELKQITQDHRLWVSKEKSYLSRALGMDSNTTIDYEKIRIEKDDIFLSMSDGVYEFLDNTTIIDCVSNNDTFNISANNLVKLALEASSDDNLTAQVIKIKNIPHKDVTEVYHELHEKEVAPLLEARQKFDGYEILRQLSATSRSHVYLAKDLETEINVVIKVPSLDMRGDTVYLERFMMEEWIARRLNNAHLLKASSQKKARNYLYTVSEFIEGESLEQWIIDNPKPSLQKVRSIAEQIATGLQAMHRQEMVHQDLRPQNVIIDTSGVIKIIDYGSTLVKGIDEINTNIRHEHVMGTLQYSAPECFIGEIGDKRSDIYSLAVIVYQMLSGKFPYGNDVAKATTRSEQKKLKYRSLYTDEYDVPLWIDETLKKALKPNQYERYSELSEFMYDLTHPNPSFLTKDQAPIFERHPIAFWKSVSVSLSLIIIYLLHLLSKA